MIDNVLQRRLRDLYNPEGSQLRNLQLNLLEILKIVDGICRRNNITYWLASGTLLGAVRHGGFIPWDDDIDIEIFRKDRKRFITACNKELPTNLHIQSHKTEPDYYLNILKVRDDVSDIGEKIHLGDKGDFDTNYKCRGNFIDIFCVEPCIPYFMKLSNRFLVKLLCIRYVDNRSPLLCHFLWIIMELLNIVYRIIGVLFANKNILYLGLSSCFGISYKYNIKYVKPVKTISFEGIEFFAPVDSDGYLSEMYGDYMELPPEKMRISHHSGMLEH